MEEEEDAEQRGHNYERQPKDELHPRLMQRFPDRDELVRKSGAGSARGFYFDCHSGWFVRCAQTRFSLWRLMIVSCAGAFRPPAMAHRTTGFLLLELGLNCRSKGYPGRSTWTVYFAPIRMEPLPRCTSS